MIKDAIKLAVTAAALGDDVRQIPRIARTMGFQGLQFDAISTTFDLLDLSVTGRREFLRLLSTQGQQLTGLRADLGARGFAPGADVDRLLSRLDKILEASAGLMAPLVCLDLGSLPAPQRLSKPKPKVTSDLAGLIFLPPSATESEKAEAAATSEPPPDPALVANVDAALAELGRLADRYNVMIAFRSELASFAALEWAIAKAGCSWFGVDLDPVSILQDEWPADEIFSRVGNSIRHVRGRDALVGASRRTKPTVLGSGNTDWPLLLTNLDAAGYRGWITVDPMDLQDRAKAAEAGREELARLMLLRAGG